MTVNVFRLKAALAKIDAQEIVPGDVVTASWNVDSSYATEGGQRRSKTGTLKFLDRSDGWFEITGTNESPGYLRSSIMMIQLDKVRSNPFMRSR